MHQVFQPIDTLCQDVRFAVRQLARRPFSSAVAIVTLALGMGLNAVVFSGVNALFLKGNAMSDVDGAAWIVTTSPQGGTSEVSLAEFERFTEATRGVLETAVLGRMPLAWQRGRTSDAIWAQLVSSEYFNVVGMKPLAGRLPRRPSQSDVPEVVVGERLWRQRLDAASVGNLRMTLNGVEHAVVGVVSERFRGPGGTFAPEVWAPVERWRELRLPDRLGQVDHRWLGMIGRIATAASVAEVESRLSGAAAGLAREWPETHQDRGTRVILMRDGHPELRALMRLGFVAMAGAGLVLLLACFNFASLLIARGVDRQKEIGIRAAIGAGTSRLVRQLVTEGLVLSLASGVVTILVAAWSQQLLAAFALPSPIPQRIDLGLDGTVIAFVAGLVVLSGVLPGLAPALHAARVDLVRTLAARSASIGGPSRARRLLIIAQVVGSTVLLTAAGLFVQSAARLAATDPGFESTNAVVIDLNPSVQGYDAARTRLLVDRLADRLRMDSRIIDVAVADRIPFYVGYARLTEASTTAGRCATVRCPAVTTYAVGAGFFRTLAISLLAGRELDGITPHSVVVSESFARSAWPGRNPVGEALYLGGTGWPHIVVGVAPDVRHRNLTDATATPTIYIPLRDADFAGALTLVARTRTSPGLLVLSIADAAHAVDPAVPPQSIKTMTERLEGARWPVVTAMSFFAVCGGLALCLATIGLFAVVSHAVSQRTREFGVRLAVGATGRTLMRDVFVSGAWLVVPGTLVGLSVAAAGARAAASVWMGVDVSSPVAYVAVGVLQAVIALAACALPARRAAHVDPLISLRAE